MRADPIPTFIDFEASSLDLVASYPIEVGICTGSGQVDSWLIRPFVLWKDWSESAQRIHGICPSTLAEEGLEISQVIERLDTLLPPVVYCDAWTFDSFWLHRLYKPTGKRPAFQLESVSTLLSPEQCASWAEVRLMVIEELGVETHRAANDARILHETWKRVSGMCSRTTTALGSPLSGY
ncbi:hypothetical protein [Hydrocarboniclastica marina]|uniref:Exonuclease domain-containing protein n=1 Tax=Hydrocarboniclastica marina TaxID=2259620 RepID=A0A4P7XD79_9ALTE|nr:hypothetical protein [Hydrocarboniclastica marina]MAL97934.1 hypothetical protein [Alteromonadaceae bacterium]QCF24545.1 hypothetical protein soil367_00445 [Hydrocarboniclastica marina]